MASVQQVAPRDKTAEHTVTFNTENGRVDFHLVFYPSRVSSEPVTIDDPQVLKEDAQGQASYKNALAFCQMMKSWDATGPVYDRRGREVIGQDEPIPLDPKIVRMMPSFITERMVSELIAAIRPNEN